MPPSVPNGQPFSAEQREYLAGLMAGIAQRQLYPYVGRMPGSERLTATPSEGGENLAADRGETIHGTPISDVTKQELWKRELHGLDAWGRLMEHADQNKFPDEADTFRFRFHGLFFVAPAQDSFMLRCRIPAGELTSVQLRGLAGMAEEYGDGKAAITTRSNLQIRGIAPANLVNTLTRLTGLGLTARGSGVDNVRNITASPTAGIDPQELLDVRPYAHALHHYILNHRDLYDLPRKFNVAFEGGGTIDTVADTNDIGFMAVRVNESSEATVVGRDTTVIVEPGIYFRVELAGITGHKQFASDAGIVVSPGESVALAAAMLRVFSEHGDRTDRKKARLKYLLDRWGVPRFLEECAKKLGFPLRMLGADRCQRRPPSLKHGHLGVYRQKQSGRNYIGVVVPVGILPVRAMRRLADIAENYGSGQLRLTPWQNLILPDVPDGFVETVKRALVRMGLHHESTHVMGGLVACTGNQGCKWSSTDTKGHAVAVGRYLNSRVSLDQPLNIHFTGCPNSCAQHYMGDIGLQGVKVNQGGQSVEGYNVVFGGGYGADQGCGRHVFTGVAHSELPALLERVLKTYLARRASGESFVAFTRRHELGALQELFSG